MQLNAFSIEQKILVVSFFINRRRNAQYLLTRFTERPLKIANPFVSNKKAVSLGK